ncbi:MAG: hypothetical protein ACRD4U_11395 [Candidatus Acidiferrales bacterium]
MRNTNYGKLAAGLLAAWFLFSLSASALHLFENAPGSLPLALGLAVVAPIVAFSLWYATSAEFRQFALSLNPRTLTTAQAWRLGGFVFLVLHAHGILPGLFALPAGWGDIFIGATAPLVALKLAQSGRQSAFIFWQVLGVLDLAMAVTLGVIAGFLNSGGIGTSVMSVLPLSLVPTFIVPLLIIFHLICIAQARRWPYAESSQVRQQLASSQA